MSDILKYILIALAGYLLGSISFGLISAKIGHGPDLRTTGSGNTGASNVLRTMGWKWGLITFFCDFGKGALASGIGWWLAGNVYGAMLGGLAAVIGHNWTVFHHFRGGKGVAVSTAVALVCFPIPALIAYAVALAAIALTRFISLGSMLFITVYAVLLIAGWANGDWLVIIWALVLAFFLFFRHRSNIQRLLQGKERKIGQREGGTAKKQ